MSSRTTTGNIFRDLGEPEEVAENLIIRSQLMRAIQKTIKDRGLTQNKAAKILDTEQSRVSNLMTGRISLFSIDTLINMAVRLGLHVDLHVGATARTEDRSSVQEHKHGASEPSPIHFVWQTRQSVEMPESSTHPSYTPSHRRNGHGETPFYQTTVH